MPDVMPLATVTNTYSFDYESSNAAPASGIANQHTTLSTFAINEIDHGGTNQAAFLATLNNSCWFIINGVTYSILSASAASGVLTLSVSPPVIAGPYGVQNIKFVKPDQSTTVGGPISPPIIPTSAFPPGGGVGSIGDPIGVPTFPPPTPPPIGTVPAGPLVGPTVAPAPVPPSTAGFPLLRYQAPGSATVPTAASLFPAFTTSSAYAGFPNQPPTGVPIVFANISTKPSFSGGVWTVVTPPSTATTGQIILNGWGLPGPSGLGPGPPGYPNPPGAGLPHVASEVSSGHTEPVERPVGAVFQFADAGQLHQPVPPPHSRRKRMSAHRAAGGDDRP